MFSFKKSKGEEKEKKKVRIPKRNVLLFLLNTEKEIKCIFWMFFPSLHARSSQTCSSPTKYILLKTFFPMKIHGRNMFLKHADLLVMFLCSFGVFLSVMSPCTRVCNSLSNFSNLPLSLNHKIPAEPKEKLAIMFFVVGESYDWGSGSSLDGTILSSVSRVIVVTLNYRLGLFGYLPTTIEGSKRGNYALMDIIAGLHWIHDNGADMGGDSSNITLIGHGSGASLVNLLMISPMGRGKCLYSCLCIFIYHTNHNSNHEKTTGEFLTAFYHPLFFFPVIFSSNDHKLTSRLFAFLLGEVIVIVGLCYHSCAFNLFFCTFFSGLVIPISAINTLTVMTLFPLITLLLVRLFMVMTVWFSLTIVLPFNVCETH